MTVQLLKSHVIPKTGYGESALNFLHAFGAVGIEVLLVDDCPGPLPLKALQRTNRIQDHIPLIYITGQHHHYVVPDRQPTVVRTMLETDSIPSQWVAKLNRANALWVPGVFNRDGFLRSGIHPQRLHIIPEPVDIQPDSPLSRHPSPINTQDVFTFLSIFHADTWYRKGIDILLRAYFQQFTRRDPVCLVLKTNISLDALLKLCGLTADADSPRVEMIHTMLTDTQMADLYRHVHAYVLPSRGEGVGRPYLYAMLNRLPVIAVGWSGNADFMNHQNAFLVRHQLHKSPADPGRIHLPMNWGVNYAQPDCEHLKTLMDYVFNNYQQARQKGENARRFILRNFSYQAVGKQLKDALENIDWSRHTVAPLNPFHSMYPLFFPRSLNSLHHDHAQFMERSLTSVAIYGTGQAARLAYKWVKRFPSIKNIVFLDRNVPDTSPPPRFLRRSLYYYHTFDYQRTQIVLVAAAPRYLQDIIDKLKGCSTVPLYFFGA